MSTLFVRFVLLACIASHASALFIGAKSVAHSDVSTPTSSTAAAATSTAVQTQTTPRPSVAVTTGVSPLGSGSDVFTTGSACRASWIPDTSGADTWKSMTIDLMTGSNLQMIKLGTVASQIDGTNVNVTSFNYSCPQVTPNAAIYFLQYTHGNEQDPAWTTRFAIADASGKTVPPPNANQPQGGSPAIPWGEGALVLPNTTTTTATSSSSTPSATRAANKAVVSGNARESELASVFSSYQSGNSQSTSGVPKSMVAATSLVLSTSIAAVLAVTLL